VFVDALSSFLFEALARKNGLMKSWIRRIRFWALPLIMIAALSRRLWVIATLSSSAVAVAMFSKFP